MCPTLWPAERWTCEWMSHIATSLPVSSIIASHFETPRHNKDKLTMHTQSSVNADGDVWKRSRLASTLMTARDTCTDPFVSPLANVETRDYAHKHAGHTRRQATDLTQGYVTTDAFGTDGDDTAHTAIPDYDYPNFFQALGGFPANGSLPDVVDLIFIDFIESDILTYLGSGYSEDDVSYYINENFSTRTYLPLYVQSSELFQQNANNCTIY